MLILKFEVRNTLYLYYTRPNLLRLIYSRLRDAMRKSLQLEYILSLT